MELRRALLLFAIVLGVAAVVAALASPASRDSNRTTASPPPVPPVDSEPSRPPTRVRIDGRGGPVTRRLEIDRATTVIVSVDEPGQVSLEGLGLTESAEPGNPAVFETLATRRGRYEVLFTPAGGVRARALGELTSQLAN